MRSQRGIATVTLSNKVIDYLVQKGYTQADIARMIGLSEGFVSLVRSRERGFTIEHLVTIAERLHVPLGAFLSAANPVTPKSPGHAELIKATEEISRLADRAIAAVDRSRARKVRADS